MDSEFSEGLIIRLARLATDPDGGGKKAFNHMNDHHVSAGLLARQTYRRLARTCFGTVERPSFR